MRFLELEPNCHEVVSSYTGGRLVIMHDFNLTAPIVGRVIMSKGEDFTPPIGPVNSEEIPDGVTLRAYSFDHEFKQERVLFDNEENGVLIAEERLYVEAGIIIPNRNLEPQAAPRDLWSGTLG